MQYDEQKAIDLWYSIKGYFDTNNTVVIVPDLREMSVDDCLDKKVFVLGWQTSQGNVRHGFVYEDEEWWQAHTDYQPFGGDKVINLDNTIVPKAFVRTLVDYARKIVTEPPDGTKFIPFEANSPEDITWK